MSFYGFALVLSAAFCHAGWNFLVKRIGGGPELVWLFSLASVIIYLPLALFILVADAPSFGSQQILFVLISAALHLGYFLLLQTGYRHGDLSLVYPTARATGPLLSGTFAVLVLGEHLTPQTAIGAALLIVSVVMLTGGVRTRNRQLTNSLVFGLAAGMLIGSYTVWDAYTVSILLVPPLLLDYASSVGRTVLLSPVAWARKAEIRSLWRHHRSAIILIAVLNPLAYILVLYALVFTPVIYVAPLREVSVLITVLMGSLLLGEGQLKYRLTWAAVMLIGTAILAMA